MHCRVTLSTSTCAGLSLEWAPTRTMHFCIFLPFFLVGTLMPVNAPLHDESVGDIFRWPGLQWPVACSFFLSAPTAQPDTLWQSARLKVQDFVEPATEHSMLPSVTLPLWSWISIRHSGACCAPRTSGARASSALASTATRPSRGRCTAWLDIEFPPSGSQLSRSFRLAVELTLGQSCPRPLSSLSDFVPLKRSVILSSPLAWKGDGADERGAVEAVGSGRPAAGRQADDGAGGPGPGALRPAGAAAAGPGGDGRAAGAAASQYGPRAGARARGGRADADRPLAAREVSGLQRRALRRKARHGDAAAAGLGRHRAPPLTGGGRARGLAPAPAPPSQAPRAPGPGGPDAAVGWEPARLARGARAVAVPGGRDRRRDGRTAPRSALRRPGMRRRLSPRAACDREHVRAAGEHLHGPARRAQAQR